MFQLFKQRDFGSAISDTIAFFKTYGKHYFKNYFTINGIFLIILVVLIYFISKVYMEFIMSMSNPQNNNSDYLSNYFNDNMPLFIITVVSFVVLSMLLSIINIAYPAIYLKFIEEKGNNNFSLNEIISALKANFPKMLIFLLGSLFIITPIMLIALSLNILLCFIIIGIPILFITFPALMSWYALSFHEYIIKEVGFFEALNNAYYLLKQKFWMIIGTTLVVLFIIQVVQGIITMIPYTIGLIFMFSSAKQGGSPQEAMSGLSIIFSMVMVFSVLLSYTFNNFIFINQGLIYYSLREENEDVNTKTEIDLIGTDSE